LGFDFPFPEPPELGGRGMETFEVDAAEILAVVFFMAKESWKDNRTT
jgi:hypothetical protein